jgi:soluble lytic murein transglycosylase-like protein
MLPLIPIAIVGTTIYGLWRYFNPSASSAADTLSSIEQSASDIVQNITDLFPKAAPYQDAIQGAQDKYGIPSNYLAKLLNAESSFDPAIISGQRKSSVGAVGIAQFMPATSAELGVNPTDPISSIDGAGRYLSQLYAQFGNWPEAIAAYNWGSGNVSKKGLSKAPAETVNYVQKIAGVDIRNTGG